MAHTLTKLQLNHLEITERLMSCLSLLGTSFVVFTFLYSPAFRKPVNRLIFFASWGNIAYSIAALMSQAPIKAGRGSHLCHFQGFLIQMFHPADALWNLAMAINVFLAIFRKYNAQQLKALEWKYHLMCYGCPFIVAFVYIFVDTAARGSVYGPATLWCWVSVEWSALRISLVYAPAWCCILVSSSIYLLAGREIFTKRQQLRAFLNPAAPSILPVPPMENPFTGFSSTEIRVTSELTTIYSPAAEEETMGYFNARNGSVQKGVTSGQHDSHGKVVSPYSIEIGQANMSPMAGPRGSLQQRKNRAAMEANAAAWGYTRVALLFFVSMLVTWLPSSINRVYSLIYPNRTYYPFIYVAGLCLPLMGFWNSIIYITASWSAVRLLLTGKLNSADIMRPSLTMLRPPLPLMSSSAVGSRRQRQEDGESESLEEMVRKKGKWESCV